MNRKITALLLLIALFIPGAASFAQQSINDSVAELQAAINTLLDQPKFAAGRWGIRVITESGKVVFERDADKLFIPASNMKLYTTAASLDAFGPDLRFRTSVYAGNKALRRGILKGDVVLFGRGDPNISARFELDENGKPNPIDSFLSAEVLAPIEKLADQLKARGVKVITGNLIGDDSYFTADQWGAAWQWDDLLEYYSAPISALTVNDNVVTFLVDPARKEGRPPVVSVLPATRYGKLINHAVTGPGKDGKTHLKIDRKLDSDTFELIGNIPVGANQFKVDVAIKSPALFAATLLREALARRHIRVTGTVKSINATDRVKHPLDQKALTEIAFIESQPVSVLIKAVNKPSQNLHAEILLRQLGELKGTPRDLDDLGRPRRSDIRGIEVLRQFLSRAGVNGNALSIRDGSGLARHDLVSPASTTGLLLFMLHHQFAPVFLDSLPVPGDGTLRSRMLNSPAKDKLSAKTGSLAYVRSLSGYVTTAGGERLIFSFMGNNYLGPGGDLTSTYDKIASLLAAFSGRLQ